MVQRSSVGEAEWGVMRRLRSADRQDTVKVDEG
jgi:hypothetical protein